MSETHTLVEHFFRHEYGNLVSVLTRAFGISRIDLVEDMVGAAIFQAMDSWKKRGVPENAGGWIHKVARNKILDALRREKTHEKALGLAGIIDRAAVDDSMSLIDHWLDEPSLPDSLLRMMFVCCHPAIDRMSQIAMTLKTLCGFSVNEIARGLLLKPDSAKKRIQRAKAKLAEAQVSIEFPSATEVQSRLNTVHDVLYLMFNEGYSTSHGIDPIRDEVCEEAVRLCLMISQHQDIGNNDSKALLALMLFHASRLDSRIDSLGNTVLLEHQDRTKWDRELIEVATKWLIKSVVDKPSRFHLEAVIASKHCAAANFEETDWQTIIRFYNRLIELFPSPIYRLNCAIAIAQTGDFEKAKGMLTAVRHSGELKDYYLLDCADAYVLEKSGNPKEATECYLIALAKPIAEHQKSLIKERLAKLSH